MKWVPLNRNDAALYKGIAILMIVTHNFMHLFPEPKQNEFSFYSEGLYDLLSLMWHEPGDIVRVSLSFFGHYGVQIFIFLSAYGLTKKYSMRKLKCCRFIFERMIKIYPSFLLAILLWATIVGLSKYGLLGPLKMLYWSLESLILKLALLSNLVPGEALNLVGPWWFISFIFQFYLIFPMLLRVCSLWNGIGMFSVSVMSVVFTMMVHGEVGGVNIYFTVLGHLPEFCLGIYISKNDDEGLKIPFVLLLLALTTYVLGNIYEIFWYVSHLSFLVILLACFSVVVPIINRNRISKSIVLFFGFISMPLFLVNGFLRQPFITWAIDYNHWLLTMFLCLMFLLVSLIVALMLLIVESRLMSGTILRGLGRSS